MLVRVYRNLTRRCWSIKEPGKRVQHLEQLKLKRCRFLVQEAGRQRVLKTQMKNVHAWVEGELLSASRLPEEACPSGYVEVTYSPYVCGCFTLRTSGSKNGWPVYRADRVVLTAAGKAYALLSD